jgi:hypothetical protein
VLGRIDTWPLVDWAELQRYVTRPLWPSRSPASWTGLWAAAPNKIPNVDVAFRRTEKFCDQFHFDGKRYGKVSSQITRQNLSCVIVQFYKRHRTHNASSQYYIHKLWWILLVGSLSLRSFYHRNYLARKFIRQEIPKEVLYGRNLLTTNALGSKA